MDFNLYRFSSGERCGQWDSCCFNTTSCFRPPRKSPTQVLKTWQWVDLVEYSCGQQLSI